MAVLATANTCTPTMISSVAQIPMATPRTPNRRPIAVPATIKGIIAIGAFVIWTLRAFADATRLLDPRPSSMTGFGVAGE